MIQKLIKSLLEPAAYQEPTAKVRLVETHVSYIFLTDRFVYKVKKAVDYGFLDFTTLDRRRFYCAEEVRLNARLCPDIYLGVVELRETPAGASFAGGGKVIDYAVKMKRLPEERMLDRLLERGEAGAEEMARIAQLLADFHAQAERGAQIDAGGSTAVIRSNWDENFRQAAPFVRVTISPSELTELRLWVDGFLRGHEELFRERVAGGFIRDCDGDLHSGNICITDRVCIFDCIEFNEKFRHIDTASDLAFLLMDLEYAGRPDLSASLLSEYRERSGDRDQGPLLRFYQVHRAFVRGKVKSFRLNEPGLSAEESARVRKEARRYFRLARGYTLRERMLPSLIITCGVTGTGKSVLAQALSFELGLLLRRSDVLRKELATLPAAGVAGLYSAEMDRATYLALLDEAERALSSGQGIVVDATFRRKKDRAEFRELAARHGVPFFVLETRCPEAVARERLEARRLDPHEVSDGRWEHYRLQKAEFEETAPGESVPVDSTLPVSAEVDLVLRAMRLTS